MDKQGGSNQQAGTQDDRLIRALMDLRVGAVSHAGDGPAATFDSAMALLKPFTDIIRSPATSGPITLAALSAVHRLLTTTIDPAYMEALDGTACMAEIAAAVTQCQFEATDTQSDEVVIMQIIRVLVACICCPAGRLAGIGVTWDIFQAIFDISREPRHSKVLRKIACCALADVVRGVCVQFTAEQACVPPSVGPGSPRQDRATSAAPGGLPALPEAESAAGSSPSTAEPAGADVDGSGQVGGVRGAGADDDGVPAPAPAVRILHFLVQQVDVPDPDELGMPRKGSTPLGTRILCFRLLNAIIEQTGVGGGRRPPLVACKPAMDIVKDQLCRSLLTTVRTNDNRLLSTALRTVYLLTTHLRAHLRMQVEAFVNVIYLRTLESPQSAAAAHVQVVVESLHDILSQPDLLPDLYLSYDCAMGRSDLVQNLYRFLSKSAFPVMEAGLEQQTPSYLQCLSLRCLVGGVRHLARAIDDSPGAEVCASSSSEDCFKRLSMKRVVQRGVELFNKKPKHGIKHLQEAGVLANPLEPLAMATFLRRTPGLDKQTVGQYLGTGSAPADDDLRKHYVGLFDLSGQRLLSGLRQFLEAFRLPGEAQQIDRVLEAFAGCAYEDSIDAPLLASRDVAFLLSFSIMLLNTDLHNPNIKPEKKMKLEDFVRNNTNYGEENNHGKDLPRDFLCGIYQEIQVKQINVESGSATLTSQISEDRWRDLIRQALQDDGEQGAMDTEGKAGEIADTGISGAAPAAGAPSNAGDTGDAGAAGDAGDAGGAGDAGDAGHAGHAGARRACPATTSPPSALARVHGAGIFSLVWSPTLAALSVIFDTGHAEGSVVSEAVDGLMVLAQVASHYRLVDVVDRVVITLCNFCTKARQVDEPADGASPSHAAGLSPSSLGLSASLDIAESQLLKLHEFGSTAKAQAAAKALCAVVQRFGSTLRNSWSDFVHFLIWLYEMRLLPAALLSETSDGILKADGRSRLSSVIQTTFRSSRPATLHERSASSAGLFGWIWGAPEAEQESKGSETRDEDFFLSGAHDMAQMTLVPSVAVGTSSTAGGEPADEAGMDQAARLAVLAAQECALDTFVMDTKFLDTEALLFLVRALIGASRPAAAANGATATKHDTGTPPTDPTDGAPEDSSSSTGSALLCLLLLTEIALRNRDRIEVIWPAVREHLGSIVAYGKAADASSVIMAAKASLCLVRLAVRLIHKDSVSDQVRRALRDSASCCCPGALSPAPVARSIPA